MNTLTTNNNNVVNALATFIRRLNNKLNYIQTWGTKVNAHVHGCNPLAACAIAPLLQTPPHNPFMLPLNTRSLLNATEDEYNATVKYLNELFVNDSLTESETAMKDFVFSNPELLTEILQPMLENLKNETVVVDLKQANLSKQNDDIITALPLFHLNNGSSKHEMRFKTINAEENNILHGDESHNIHDHEHKHHEPQEKAKDKTKTIHEILEEVYDNMTQTRNNDTMNNGFENKINHGDHDHEIAHNHDAHDHENAHSHDDHEHEHAHNHDQHHEEQNNIMETVGRKLSRKFSGITDILEKKMKADKLKTQLDEEEAMRKKTEESALLFGLI